MENEMNETMVAELEKVKSAYSYLKMQVNPHFLYNTLNFFYSKAVPLSTELADGIITLAHILRYSLSEETDHEGRVMLDKEIEHFKNIIKINQVRYRQKLPINVAIIGNISIVRIMPFALMAIVENALKHGNLTDLNKPINIKTVVTEEWIDFYCHNYKKNGPVELTPSLDMNNIKACLQQQYQGRQQFSVSEDEETYEVHLRLPLN